MSTKAFPFENIKKEFNFFFKDRFNLHEDEASEKATIADIKDDVVFRGANLWILIFAILVCSVGLDVNSTAVVIGAMLISPLMGPIMGIGLGIGIYDFELIVTALKKPNYRYSYKCTYFCLLFLDFSIRCSSIRVISKNSTYLLGCIYCIFWWIGRDYCQFQKRKK